MDSRVHASFKAASMFIPTLDLESTALFTEPAQQGLGNERVVRGAEMGSGGVEGVERLGGILKHYRRAA